MSCCCKSGACKWIAAALFVGAAGLATVSLGGCDGDTASTKTTTTTKTETPAGTTTTTEKHEKTTETNPK